MLKQTLFAASLISLFSSTAFAASRYYVLDFATLNPPNLLTMKDSRNNNDNFKASGKLELNDDTKIATRTLKLCLNNFCTEKTENYAITGYAPGTSAVHLKDQSNGNNHSMIFVWNYFNLGFMETLPSTWGIFSNQNIAISWKDNNDKNTLNANNGIVTPEYSITAWGINKVECPMHALNCVPTTFMNTSGKTIKSLYIIGDIKKNGVYVDTLISEPKYNIASGTSINIELNAQKNSFNEFEFREPIIIYQ